MMTLSIYMTIVIYVKVRWYLQQALTIATFEPGIYDVIESFAPSCDEI